MKNYLIENNSKGLFKKLITKWRIVLFKKQINLKNRKKWNFTDKIDLKTHDK